MKRMAAVLFIFFMLAIVLLRYFGFEVKRPSSGFRFIKESQGIREYQLLSNGLKVILTESHTVPVVSVMMNYGVGTREEQDGRTGGSHMLEHMMFKGTHRYNRRSGNSFFLQLGQAGALINATTGMDMTRYYSLVPKERVPLVLKLEADRMRNALLEKKDFETERGVILNELERLENSSVYALTRTVWKTGFEKHPYRNLAIGRREDLEKMTVRDLRYFYDEYYRPDNSVLIVAGDFKESELLKEIERAFSGIQKPGRPMAKLHLKEPSQSEPRFVRLERPDSVQAVLVAHKAVPWASEDARTLEVLADILGGGKMSRLYRALIESGLAVELMTSVSDTLDPGFFQTLVYPAPGMKLEPIQKVILNVYQTIAQEGVSEEELSRSIGKLSARALYEWDGPQAVAEGLADALATGDWTLFAERRSRLKTVTREKVRAAALKYLVPERLTTGYLLSRFSGEKMPAKGPIPVLAGEVPQEEHEKDREPVLLDSSPPFQGKRLTERVRVTSEENLKILSLKTESPQVIHMTGSFLGAGQAYSKNKVLPSLTAAMLELGTQKRNKFEIASRLDEKGIDLSFGAGTERVIFRSRCLKKDLPEMISILAEELRMPVFKGEDFNRLKNQYRVALEEEKTDTEARADRAFSRIVFPPTHPEYSLSWEEEWETLEKVQLSDVKAFYETHYGLNQWIFTAVGDVDHETLVQTVKKVFQGWKPASPDGDFTRKASAESLEFKTIPLEGKNNLDILMGHGCPLTRHDPDYPALFLSQFALGGDFASRLNAAVRDRQGLTYFIYSQIEGITGDLEGAWKVHLITTPVLYEKALQSTLQEIRIFAEKGIGDHELSRNQNTVRGRFLVGLASETVLADQIRRMEEMGLGLSYLDSFTEKISRLTLAEVNRVIRRYLHPERLNFVIAGNIPESQEGPSKQPAQGTVS